jgi:hypothetical protein
MLRRGTIRLDVATKFSLAVNLLLGQVVLRQRVATANGPQVLTRTMIAAIAVPILS